MDGLQPGATGLVTLQPDLHPQHVAPLALVDLAASCVSREIRCELWEQACRKRKASVTGMMRFRDRRQKAYELRGGLVARLHCLCRCGVRR